MEKDKLIKMLIGFLPLLLLFLDPPEGMDPKAWGLFPFYAGAILMVMLRPVGEATALAIFLGLYAVMMRGHTVALSGFALTMTWLVVGAYIIAQAFRDTNLGKRISFWMIRQYRKCRHPARLCRSRDTPRLAELLEAFPESGIGDDAIAQAKACH